MTALFLGVTSVGFTVAGPKILGDATNVLFNGVVGKRLPAGITKAAGGRVSCALTTRASSPT